MRAQTRMPRLLTLIAIILGTHVTGQQSAVQDLIAVRRMSPELAREIALAAVRSGLPPSAR